MVKISFRLSHMLCSELVYIDRDRMEKDMGDDMYNLGLIKGVGGGVGGPRIMILMSNMHTMHGLFSSETLEV